MTTMVVEGPARLYARILVTGSSGFIGEHLARALLARGYRVLGVDIADPPRTIPRLEFVRGDLRDRQVAATVIRQFLPQAVLHLAARTDLDEERELEGYAVNTTGVENLLSAVEATAGIQRAICTSS